MLIQQTADADRQLHPEFFFVLGNKVRVQCSEAADFITFLFRFGTAEVLIAADDTRVALLIRK